jgi:ABC-type lipoprotein release transport system permease subunit
MTLTFLNLVVVRGILVGLIEGSIVANRERFSSDVFLSVLNDKKYIENSPEIISYIKSLPNVETYSERFVAGVKVESGYKTKVGPNETPDYIGAQIAGIDPERENMVTNLSKYVIEGNYLDDNDTDSVLMGASLLFKYASFEQAGSSPLKNVGVGDKIRLTVNGKTIEVTVKGIAKGKVDEIDRRIIMTNRQVRQLIGRNDLNVSEISVKVKPDSSAEEVKALINNQGFDQFAKIQTSTEAVPKFVSDITLTFSILGNFIGSIGLAVASITIFIVIFVNAITRRKYIGILKGIGVNSDAIQMSYVFQALFYALVGITAGVLIVFLVIKPYFDANPINFPFSDGILVADFNDVLTRGVMLMISTAIAGYLPARLIVKQNTLDAILGR